MKIIKVLTHQDSNGFTVTAPVKIAVKSWYQKPVVWISVVTAVASTLALLQQYHPDFAWIGLASGLLNIVANLLEQTVSPSSLIG